MITQDKSKDYINESIEGFFGEYIKNPIRYMREYGLQVHLKNLIQARLKTIGSAESKAQIRQNNSKKPLTDAGFLVERTQLEVRIQSVSENLTGKEMTDIVVLKCDSPVTLTCYPMGHLDIVAKIDICDVDTAIELKAACSSDKSERHKFRLDIDKLLKLTEEARKADRQLDAHFVLVDKSLAIRGVAESSKHRAQQNWHEENISDVRKWTENGKYKFLASSPMHTLLDKEPSEANYIHVWFLVESNDSESGFKLQHKFVSRALPPSH